MGIHILFYRPMVMAPVKERIEYFLIRMFMLKFSETKSQDLASFVLKPLFNCPVCMSSIYGSVYFWLSARGSIIGWLVYLVMLSGLVFFMMLLAYNDPRK